MSVLINLTDRKTFTRKEFDDYKVVEIALPKGSNGFKDPVITFTEDGKILVTPKNAAPESGSFFENNVPACSDFPIKSLLPGFGGELTNWEPLEGEVSESDQQVWVLCESVSFPLANKGVKFSMLPLDEGLMLFCLKEGGVRFDVYNSDGYKAVNLTRGDFSLPEGVLFTTIDSSEDSLSFVTNAQAKRVLRNSFISGTVTASEKVYKVKHSQHTSENRSLNMAFSPNQEYTARLDGGRAYREEQERLKQEELERKELLAREAEAKARAEAELAEKLKKEEEAKSKKRTRGPGKGTAKTKERSKNADDLLQLLNM